MALNGLASLRAAPSPLDEERRSRAMARVLWAILATGCAAPLLLVRLPPLYDYYHWLFEGKLIATLLAGSGPSRAAVAGAYSFIPLPVPNLAGSLGMALFMTFLPPLVAGRIFAALCAILPALGHGFLVRTVQRRPTLVEFLGLPWSLGFFFYKGYLGYQVSLALLYVVIALLHRITRAGSVPPSRRGWVAICGLATALYLSHIMAWAVLAFVLLGYAVALTRRARFARAASLLVTLVPSIIMLAWYVVGRESQRAGSIYTGALDKIASLASPLLLFFRTDPVPSALPVFWANVFFLVALLALVLAGRQRQPREAGAKLLVRVGALLAALAAVLPFSSLGSMVHPDARLILPAVLIVLAGIGQRRLTMSRAVAVALVVLALVALHVREYRRADTVASEVEGALLRSVPPGSTLLSLALAPSESGTLDCEGRNDPSFGIQSLKWIGVVWLVETGELGVDLMDTSVLERAGDEKLQRGLVTSTQNRSQIEFFPHRTQDYARRFSHVLLLGCPHDLGAAEYGLSARFLESESGPGFRILHRRFRR